MLVNFFYKNMLKNLVYNYYFLQKKLDSLKGINKYKSLKGERRKNFDE